MAKRKSPIHAKEGQRSFLGSLPRMGEFFWGGRSKDWGDGRWRVEGVLTKKKGRKGCFEPSLLIIGMASQGRRVYWGRGEGRKPSFWASDFIVRGAG